MAARKSVDQSKLRWRIEPLTLSDNGQVIDHLKFLNEVLDHGNPNNETFITLKRHNGLIISGYVILRGKAEDNERAAVFYWQPLLKITQQKALNYAFNHLKRLNQDAD
jgi:hypothetical protein